MVIQATPLQLLVKANTVVAGEGSSVGKVLAEFAHPGPMLKQTPGVEACTCDPSSEAGGSPGLHWPSSLP